MFGTDREQKIAELIEQTVKEQLAESNPDLDVKLTNVTKNNGVELTAIAAGRDGVLANLYIDKDVQAVIDGQANIDEAAAVIARTLAHEAEKIPTAFRADSLSNEFSSPDTSCIQIKLINREANAAMLAGMPHRDICGDLSIVALYRIGEEASVRITNDLCARMGMTGTEVIGCAVQNMKNEGYAVKSMVEMMADSMDISEEQAKVLFGDMDGLYEVTNADKHFGAAGIYLDKDLKQEVADRIDGDFYILPASIHMCICIPAESMTPRQAAEMIKEVNENEVEAQEVLAAHPYLVDAQTLRITIPCEEREELVADEPRQTARVCMGACIG